MAMNTVEEIRAQQRQERQQTLKDAETLQALVSSPGWKRYLELIEAVGQNFHVKLMTPLDSVLEVTRSEHAKGALYGLNIAASLPGAKIAEARELRDGEEE